MNTLCSIAPMRNAARNLASFFLRVPLLLALGMTAPLFAAGTSWQWLSPTPTGCHINRFAYGSGQFVGVGSVGEILTSPDGATWTHRESGTNESILRVVHDGTRFVAISTGSILTSTDGVTWAKQTMSGGTLIDLAFGNNLLVAVSGSISSGQPYRFLTSTDGTNWTSKENTTPLLQIRFANGIFVAVDNTGRAFSSTDGLTWTATEVKNTTNTPFFAAGNGRFLLSYGSEMTYVSTDGTSWREVTSHPLYTAISPQPLTVPYLLDGVGRSTMGFAGGYFYIQQQRYAMDANRTYRSADGETWTPVAVYELADLATLTSGGGVMVGTERETSYYGPNYNHFEIHSSADGLTWTDRSTYTLVSGSSLVYGLGRFFSSGKMSSDAITWIPTAFEPTHAAGDLLFSVTSRFEFSTSSSTEIDPRAITSVVVSNDALTGTTVDVKMPTPRSVAFGSGRYVFVGDNGTVSSSANGTTWTAGASGTTSNLSAVIFAFNRFIAIGSAGTLLTSPDGLAWTAQNTGTTVDFLSLVAGPDRVVVGTAGTATAVPALTLSGNLTVEILTSRRSDALSWFDGEYTSIEFYIPNYYSSVASVAKSTDGSTWTDSALHIPWGPKGRARMAAGNGVALLQMPTGVDWTLNTLFTSFLIKKIPGSTAPVVTHAPVATTVPRGQTATFSVGATGSGPLTFQWNRNGTPISGATSQILSVALAKDADAGDYTVTVSNSAGSATSAAAKLTVQDPVPLTITQQPVGGTLYEFQSLFLTVSVTGSGPITYQWRKNGVPVNGATSSSIEFYTASYSMDNYVGTYDVVVTAPFSTVTSQTAIVSRSGPAVTVNRSGAAAGGTTIVTATVVGKSPFSYQWGRAGGQIVEGATNATLIFPNLNSLDSNSYWVKVTDADGYTTQAFFTMPSTGTDPALTNRQATASAGQKLTLRAPLSVSAMLNVSFQWKFNDAPIAGATSWSYTTPEISNTTTGTYSVVVTDTTSSSATTYTTTIALETAPAAPAFVAQTTGRVVSTGNATTFSVNAPSATSYQWQVNTNGGTTWSNLADGGPYSGTTTNTLTIANTTSAMNNYQYRCVAGNATGSTTSSAATLSLNSAPLLAYPAAIARDGSGNLFVSDTSAHVIRKITPTGAISTFAGTEGNIGSQDGTGTSARFNQPGGLAFDGAGNLYLADAGNATIRKITASGVVTTLAGDITARGNVDGTGNAARFNHPIGLAVDSAGNVYVCDSFANTVRKITPAGSVTTLAGTNLVSGSTDGSGTTARFNNPAGIAVDASGNVYVADTYNSAIRKITTGGVVTTLAGLPGVAGSNDGTGGAAFFSQPTGLATDASGNVYVADTGNALIRRVTSAGVVTLLAGVPGIAGLSDGVGLNAQFDQPRGVAIDASGNLYVADTGNAALRKVTTGAMVTTLTLSAAPAPAPAPVISDPVTPTVPSGSSSGSSSAASSSGGGAMTPWFAGVMLLLFAFRRRRH